MMHRVDYPSDWLFENDHGTIAARPAGMVVWLRENIRHDYEMHRTSIAFADRQDATMFKLRFC